MQEKFAAFETGRCLHAIDFASGHPNHPVAPETVAKKIRLGLANEILLLR